MEYEKIKQNTFHPKYLWREDGERVTLNKDGVTYSFDFSQMVPKYEYSYGTLLSAGFLLREPLNAKS